MTIVASHAEMALRWPAVVARAEAAIAVFAADERRLACRHVLDGSLSFTLCAEHPSGGVRGEDAPSKYKLTDVGNAARLVDAHGHDFRYVAGWGTWLVWDGRRWKRDGTGKVVEAAKAVARDLWREVASESDAAKRKELARWAGQSEGANRIDAGAPGPFRARSGRRARGARLASLAVQVANGTLDLSFPKGGLRPHRREDLLTKLAPVVHDVEERASCPTWLRFLEQILPDQGVRTFVQDAVGYALVGVTTEHVLFFPYGTGANGKTTWAQTMLALFADYGRQAEPDLLLANREAHPTGVADLAGARFVVSTEIDDGRRLAEATVKRLTGGDRLKARFMRQDFFEFEPTHTLFLVANHRPIVRGTDHAIWRRLRLIPFTVTIPPEEQDHTSGRSSRASCRGSSCGLSSGAGGGRCLVSARRRQSCSQRTPTVPRWTSSGRSSRRTRSSWRGRTSLPRTCTGPIKTGPRRMARAWASQRRFGAALSERGFERRQYGAERRWHWFGLGLLNPRTELNPSFPITDRTRAGDRQTGSTGSEGFIGSQQT